MRKNKSISTRKSKIRLSHYSRKLKSQSLLTHMRSRHFTSRHYRLKKSIKRVKRKSYIEKDGQLGGQLGGGHFLYTGIDPVKGGFTQFLLQAPVRIAGGLQNLSDSLSAKLV